VEVEYPKSVVLRQRLSLVVGLTRDPAASDAIPIAAEVGDTIDIVVSPKTGFVVEGSADGQLHVTEDAEPLPIQIKLRATELGMGRITIFAFRDGTGLGSLTIAPEVVAAEAETGSRATGAATLAAVGPSTADLELLIFEERDTNGLPQLTYRLSSKNLELGLNLKQFGPVVLRSGPGSYFTGLFEEIEQLPVETNKQRERATERLHALGTDLFSTLLPNDLQTLLWGLKDKIQTVWVQSDEPWVPWEICRLVGKEGGRIVEGPFFCEAFNVTRWIPGLARIGSLEISKIGLIVPPDSQLPQAGAEAAMVHELGANGRSVEDVTPTYLDVRKALADAKYDVIHFVGHGAFPDSSDPTKAEISLAGTQKLHPSDISGVSANLGLKKPIVFLNACQVGRQSMALTGIGGWASAMLRAGAGAFVGAHWEVTDDLALAFARRFYERVIAGDSLAVATHEARAAIRDTGDPTWLAYTVFADPGATVAG
jgi:hypothetical protein